MTAIDFAFAVWETFYITILSTAFALVLGLPLGVLLVAGDKDGVLPLPGWLMHALNIVINILRSVPFLILMICVFPLSRLIVGTTVGTNATIVPLVVASFPFVARLVETSLRELDAGVIEAAQSMGATNALMFVVLFVGVQAVIEWVICCLVAGAVTLPVRKFLKLN